MQETIEEVNILYYLFDIFKVTTIFLHHQITHLWSDSKSIKIAIIIHVNLYTIPKWYFSFLNFLVSQNRGLYFVCCIYE